MSQPTHYVIPADNFHGLLQLADISPVFRQVVIEQARPVERAWPEDSQMWVEVEQP